MNKETALTVLFFWLATALETVLFQRAVPQDWVAEHSAWNVLIGLIAIYLNLLFLKCKPFN